MRYTLPYSERLQDQVLLTQVGGSITFQPDDTPVFTFQTRLKYTLYRVMKDQQKQNEANTPKEEP
ncbi:hypothetical protein YDYSY3_57430 [Paenibacillus chitinolyticus]|uniref:hypothetical protein n=1 Tax=Paenibacillus chitinolyticus TaxID=79263 RepID=UPI0026E4CE8D|nr:hypothetical protein [Paenibacillus chitinolyticus]GKS14743.1 hypothetical protein YDYSY3_57430 [Paenibacillus chitinolyticus]